MLGSRKRDGTQNRGIQKERTQIFFFSGIGLKGMSKHRHTGINEN